MSIFHKLSGIAYLAFSACSPFLPSPRQPTGAELAEAPSRSDCSDDARWHNVAVVGAAGFTVASLGTILTAVELANGHNYQSTVVPVADVGVGLGLVALASGIASAVLAEQYVTDGCPALVGPLANSAKKGN
jgi:hypothetical protein